MDTEPMYQEPRPMLYRVLDTKDNGGRTMSAQPADTHDEQTTDPQVLARLKQALADLDRDMLRGRITRAAKASPRVSR